MTRYHFGTAYGVLGVAQVGLMVVAIALGRPFTEWIHNLSIAALCWNLSHLLRRP